MRKSNVWARRRSSQPLPALLVLPERIQSHETVSRCRMCSLEVLHMKNPRKPCFVGTGMLDVFKGFRNLSASSFEGFASKASGEQAVSLLCLAHSIMAKPSFAKLSCFWLGLYYLRLATITTDQVKLLRVVSRLRYVRERIKHILSTS